MGIIIGEPLSNKIESIADVIQGQDGLWYLNSYHMYRQRPMDFGLVCYYKLYQEFSDVALTKLEVYHNHTTGIITMFIKVGDHEIGGRIPERRSQDPEYRRWQIDEMLKKIWDRYFEIMGIDR